VSNIFHGKTYIQCSEQVPPVWKPTFWAESTEVAKAALKHLSDVSTGDALGLFLVDLETAKKEPT